MPILAIAVAGCAGRTAPPPFTVIVRGPASSCSIALEGRIVAPDTLVTIAWPAATSGRRAQVVSDSTAPAYRCLGGAIYALQMAGFAKVEIVAAASSAGK